jgi:hypothetical protein
MEIELGKAREFAHAVGHPDPIEVGSPVPVTFLRTMAFWAGPESSAQPAGRDMSRMLHGEQTFVFHGGPIRVGETLVGQSRLEGTYSKRGRRGGLMTFTEVVTELRAPDGRLRAEVRVVQIETEAPST